MKYLEQRVEELEKELALLKAKNKLQETNLKISYSDESKFNFKEAMENITTVTNFTLDDYEFMEASVEYPEIVGSWDDLSYSSPIEKKIENEFGKIISKFKILNHEWEMDGYGYIVVAEGYQKIKFSDHGYISEDDKKIIVVTDHGKPIVVEKSYIDNKISEYKETIQESQRALFLIK
jgi:hypothetical protein